MYKYKEYLPEIYRRVDEFIAIGDVIDPVAEETYQHTVQKHFNQFINTADIPTIERWEREFNITPFDDDTIETRRIRILSRFVLDMPFTWYGLHRYIEMFSDDFLPQRDFKRRHFSLSIQLKDNLKLPELTRNLRLLIPANMTFLMRARERSKGTLYIGVSPQSAVKIRVLPYQPEDIKETVPVSIGGYGWTGQIIRVLPKEA